MSKTSMKIRHQLLSVATRRGVAVHDLTPALTEFVANSAIDEGLLTVTSRHTTTALVVNENEERLLEDLEVFLNTLVPPGAAYRHNDIHLRQCPPNEPENAHSHIMAMLLGGSESIPVASGKLSLGTWQSVLLVELDGPRQREVALQLLGQ